MNENKAGKAEIPTGVFAVAEVLADNGFEAYLVGGCVRDLLLGNEPKDWDLATDAEPSEMKDLFPDCVYENQFGTVGVKIRDGRISDPESKDGEAEILEVTTYRIESKYADKRHPDTVRFAKTLKDDLSRRDFTVNAMAFGIGAGRKGGMAVDKSRIIDFFGGKSDLDDKIIRAVGDPNDRFNEDALRMMRAIRFSVQLGFAVEGETWAAIGRNAKDVSFVSFERIRDEFSKIILSPDPAKGVEMLHASGILDLVVPEIGYGFDVTQNRHHYRGPYNTVYKHLLASLEKCPSSKLEVRLAALLHDVGKPRAKRGSGEFATFHGHEYIGARMAVGILERLRYSRKVIDKVELLVRNHMFYYNVDEVGESGVRRVVRKVGLENIKDLIDVRIADRLGSGVPKAVPYKLRHFQFMVDKVSNDPISVKQLKISGTDLMDSLEVPPGPMIGAILDVLLSKVIADPSLNGKKQLLGMAADLAKEDLSGLREMAKERIEAEREREEGDIKRRHHVG